MPLSATRAVPAGIPMPNGVPISMQAHVKAMQPPSTIPQMRISSNGSTRPPVVGTITSPSTLITTQQSSRTRATFTNGITHLRDLTTVSIIHLRGLISIPIVRLRGPTTIPIIRNVRSIPQALRISSFAPDPTHPPRPSVQI